MKNKMIAKFAAALAIGSASLVVAASPAMARHHHDDGRYYGNGYDQYRGYRSDSGRYYGRTGYDRPVYYNGYRGNRGDRGYRCRDNGTGGAVIGAIAGGLLGSQVAERGDRTTGTVIGGALGAVAGHLIDKSDGRRC